MSIVKRVFILGADYNFAGRSLSVRCVQRTGEDLWAVSLDLTLEWSCCNFVIVHRKVLLTQNLGCACFARVWLYNLLDASWEGSLNRSLGLCLNQLLAAWLSVKFRNAVRSQVCLGHRILVHAQLSLFRLWIINSIRRLSLRADSKRASNSLTYDSWAWTSLTVDLSLGSDMQVLLWLNLARLTRSIRWLGLADFSRLFGRIINDLVFCFLHSLLVWEPSWVYLVYAARNFGTSRRSIYLTVIFLSAIVRQNVFIHQEVNTSAELINRVVFLNAISGKSCKDILVFSSATTIWVRTWIKQTLEQLHLVNAILHLNFLK